MNQFTTWFCSPRALQSRFERRVNLFCFPFAGAGPSSFFGLCQAFPAWVMPFVLRLPGRESNRAMPALTCIQAMAAEVAHVILPVLNERPSIFWGHSMGALVTFELARRLCHQNEPKLLVVSGHGAPHLRQARDPAAIQAMTDEAFVELLARYGGTPKVVLEDRELLAFFMPQLRADFTALEGYQYFADTRLKCDVLCLNGNSDHLVSAAHVQAWQNETCGNFACEWLPGGHFFINENRMVIAEKISAAIQCLLHDDVAT